MRRQITIRYTCKHCAIVNKEICFELENVGIFRQGAIFAERIAADHDTHSPSCGKAFETKDGVILEHLNIKNLKEAVH